MPSTTSAKRSAACVNIAVRVAGGLLVDGRASPRWCACAPPRHWCASPRTLGDRARAGGGRLGDQAGDLARPLGGAFQRLVEQAGEAREPLLEIVALAVERGHQRLELECAARRARPRCAGCCVSISATASASERPCVSNWPASWVRSVSVWRGDRLEAGDAAARPRCWRRRSSAPRRSWPRRNRRRASPACSRCSLMFSCAPLSTSCSRMLASRRRSNRAVVSERSMLVRFQHLGDGGGGGLLRLLDRRLGGSCSSRSVRVIVLAALCVAISAVSRSSLIERVMASLESRSPTCA